MSLSHFIIIRQSFNRPALAWNHQRLDTLEHICLPPLRMQTCDDFTALILHDRHFPAEAERRLRSLVDGNKFRVVEMSEREMHSTQSMAKLLPDSAVTVTRLDNDDALSTRFVETLRHHAAPVNSFRIINFEDGIVWRNRKIRRTRSFRQNMFITCCAPHASEMVSPYDLRHVRIEQDFPGRVTNVVTEEPMWMFVRHRGASTFHLSSPPKEDDLPHAQIDTQIFPINLRYLETLE